MSLSLNESNHKALQIIAENPNITQRELARKLGVSLGSANYCIQALIDKGLVKIKNFSNNKNKKSYSYLLTPTAIKSKVKLTIEFLKYKKVEYEKLKKEIDMLEKTLEKNKYKELL